MQGSNILVTVIVPTKNSQRTLEACLESIQKQTYPHIELVVVDNLSTDETVRIAKKYTEHVYTHGPERSAQRNFGAQKSSGQYLCFVDSDMVLRSSIIEECVQNMSEHTVCILTEESFGIGFWAQVKRKERSMYIGNDNIEAPRLFSKKMYQDVSGYNEQLTGGEDWELYDRLKKENVLVYRTKSLVLHDEGKITIDTIFKKKVLYGKAFATFRKGGASMEGRGVVDRYVLFLKKWREGLSEPILYIGAFVLKCVEFWGAFLGVILGYTSRVMLRK